MLRLFRGLPGVIFIVAFPMLWFSATLEVFLRKGETGSSRTKSWKDLAN
jgi:hypothetical protein